MFVKNKSELLKLSRNYEETNILDIIIHSIEHSLEVAQPLAFLTSSVSISDKSFKIQERIFNFSSYDNFFLLSFGKASQTMTEWVLEHFPVSFSRIILVSPEECDEALSSKEHLTFFKAGHPLPNPQSIEAAEYALSMLEKLSSNDLCIILISGGGSSLLDAPDNDLPFSNYVNLIELLLHSGASIHEINTIRKHLSKVKGGKLATKTKASLISLIISDVVGNDLSVIASGPTVPDESSWQDCLEIVRRYNLIQQLPQITISHLENGALKKLPDTPSDPSLFDHVSNFRIGDNLLVLERVEKELKKNYCTKIIDSQISGEAREKGEEMAKLVSRIYTEKKKSECSPFYFVLFGGETTVEVGSKVGLGGRNQELALSFALATRNNLPIYMASFGTDGIDGNSSAAGALVGPFTITNEIKMQDALQALNNHNSNEFFKENNGEIITGYTGTNIMDIGIICIKITS